jgi:hypothetical protein
MTAWRGRKPQIKNILLLAGQPAGEWRRESDGYLGVGVVVGVVGVVVVVVEIGFSGAGAIGFCAPFLFFFGFLFSLPCFDFSPIVSLPFSWLHCL